MEEISQVITKFLDGKHKTLNFTTPTIPVLSVKARIHDLTGIPIADQLLLSNGKTLDDNQTLTRLDQKTQSFPTVRLLLRLRGGKGGFGSLLRGNHSNKKTSNFDACRDIYGRRLRDVNKELKLEEWNAGKKDREYEKMAEEFLKKSVKLAKKSGQGSSDGRAEKYVEKYRKDSAKCMEEVDRSVRESLANGFKGKRKGVAGEGGTSKSKKLKMLMGKKKVYDSDSDSDSDSEEEEDGSDANMVEETEKSVVVNIENHSDSNKAADGSSGSIYGGKLEGGSSVGCSSESGSEEEKETIPDGEFRTIQDSDGFKDLNKEDIETYESSRVQNKDSDVAAVSENEALRSELGMSIEATFVNVDNSFCQVSNIPSVQEVGVSSTEDGNADVKLVADSETVSAKSDGSYSEKPLNFDDYSSATEMEVLGLERLKSELQTRGLKCGGTLHERAARLFLLKTTPLEKLPKKLLAK